MHRPLEGRGQQQQADRGCIECSELLREGTDTGQVAAHGSGSPEEADKQGQKGRCL